MMQQVSFPYPVKLQAAVPTLEGLRHSPFVNIDGEAFGKPTMNGFWRFAMNVVAGGMQSELALSAFVTAMSAASAECVVPVCVQWRPNDNRGRRLSRGGVAPVYTFDHIGFANEPFEGFTLRASAPRRASYIDVNKPALSQLWPGHYISLGDRLHQVVNVSHIGDHPNRIRVSVMPNLRAAHASGTVVVVDQLRLRCRMESGDQIGLSTQRFKTAQLSFIEAF